MTWAAASQRLVGPSAEAAGTPRSGWSGQGCAQPAGRSRGCSQLAGERAGDDSRAAFPADAPAALDDVGLGQTGTSATILATRRSST